MKLYTLWEDGRAEVLVGVVLLSLDHVVGGAVCIALGIVQGAAYWMRKP